MKLLIEELSGFTLSDFLFNLNVEIKEDKKEIIYKALYEYLEHKVPAQYILGYAYFYGYKFSVNRDVLIPRKETEELVEATIRYINQVFTNKDLKLVDLGTGSGCIGITLKKEIPSLDAYAVDISHEALEVAKNNAKILDAPVTFLEGNMLKPIIDQNLTFDVIVSNPPYVKYSEEVDDIVLKNEPHLALFAPDEKGVSFYEQILADARTILNKPGLICFEHGFKQKGEMLELCLKYFPDADVFCIRDLSGNDRLTILINR